MNIQAFIYDGFDELDVIGVYEPLRMAGFNVQLVTLQKQGAVVSAHGLKLLPDGVLDLQKPPDLLIVPGGGWVARAEQGAWQQAKDQKVLSMLDSYYQAGVTMVAVCTGVMLLAKAGLLKGRAATTNHGVIEELRAEGAKVVAARVVDAGHIITAGGVSSSIDLGLWLVEKLVDVAKAKYISELLEFEARGIVWQADEN